MEWTREKTLLLISEYRQRRGLWDMTCDEYRKKDVKHKLLNEVSEVLGGNIPIQELEKKFHTLRTQYHREISRMKRKEPYDSKWFGYKNLVFLSSPYACRSVKGRPKASISSESGGGAAAGGGGGTVTRKIALREVTILPRPPTENNNPSSNNNSNNNMNEDYAPVTRKLHTSSRAHELEKLIEETTKDVDDIDDQEDDVDAKPKLDKELVSSYVHGLTDDQTETLDTQSQQQQQHQSTIVDIHQPGTAMETVSFQANESGELHYQSTPTQNNGPSAGTAVHVVPTRIIKIQRRDTVNHDDSYFEDQHHQLHPTTAKRIYYDPNVAHNATATILTATTLTQNGSGGSGSVLTTSPAGAVTNVGTLRLPRVSSIVNTTTLSPPKPASSPVLMPAPRDEFATYGEYVANEMRAITNREVLIALKHKINTAIFEANMSELQK